MTASDQLHLLAFERLLQLPGHDHTPVSDSDMGALAPGERERAFNIAIRRLAFQTLYEIEASGADPGSVTLRLQGVEGLGPMAMERVRVLVEGAYAQRKVADAEFQTLAPEWPAHRQAAVDRAILRLAHYEMSAGIAPSAVVVNEAVELARHFSTEKSPAFINALLDRVLKRLAPPEQT